NRPGLSGRRWSRPGRAQLGLEQGPEVVVRRVASPGDVTKDRPPWGAARCYHLPVSECTRRGHSTDHLQDPLPWVPLPSPHQRRPVPQSLPARPGTYGPEIVPSRDATRESAAARCGVARRKTGRGAPAGAAPATTWRSTRDRLGATEGSPAKPSQTDPS